MHIDEETKQNIKTLIDIRDDVTTSPAVRIQAIQTMQKIMDSISAASTEDNVTEADIMNKIRGTKK